MASIFKRGDMWRAQVRRKGHPTLTDSFPTKQEAQKWAREKEHAIDKGRRTPAGLRWTLGALIDKYEDEISTRPVGRTKKRTLKKLKREFATVRLDEVTKDTLLNFVSKEELRGIKPQSIMGDVLYLRTALRYGGPLVDAEEAVAWASVKINAAYDFLVHARRLKNPEQRERRVSDEELEALYEFFRMSNRRVIPINDIMLLTVAIGLRRGEIVGPGGILVQDVNVQERTLRIRDRKDPGGVEGNDQIIPLITGPFRWRGRVVDPIDILKRQPNFSKGRGRFFPFGESTLNRNWDVAVEKLKIDNLVFHDLRHESISRMFEHGMEIPEVALVSGHKDWKNLKRYTHLKPSFVHRKLVTLK